MADEAMAIEGHTSRAFDGELSSLHVQVVEMGGLLLLQLREAADAYTEWDPGVARRVLERERLLDARDRELDGRALALIARRQPVASDLRAIMALSKIVAELERAGDEARKIAQGVLGRAGSSALRPGFATARDARHLARLAVDMLRLALDALDRLDGSLARQVVALDRELDDEYANGLRRLMTRAMEDSRFFGGAMEAAFVLKSLERVGDHARNVVRLILSIGREAGGPAPRGESPPPDAAPR